MNVTTLNNRAWQHRTRHTIAWLTALTFSTALAAAIAQVDPKAEEDASKERLIKKMLDGEDADIMARIIAGMGDAEQALEKRFDPGDKTQTMQQRVLDDLDRAIEQARQNMRSSNASQGTSGDDQPSGEMPPEQSSASDQSDSAQAGSRGQATDDIEVTTEGLLEELRRQWGNLPPRAREEILQGIDEDMHEAFREQIYKYYEALSKQREDNR